MNETREQQIERLKQNEKPFGLLSEEDQAFLSAIGSQNTEIWTAMTCWDVREPQGTFSDALTYRIRPDYHEEPEYDNCEVFNEGGQLKYISPTGKSEFIGNAVDDAGFAGFWVRHPDREQYILADHVAENLAKGNVIVAKFRKAKT